MKIIVAPDSFKGSLGAAAAAQAMAAGARRASPAARIVCIPLADGGEGTVEALVGALGGQRCEAVVQDPLGRPVRAAFGMVEPSTAVIEMAAASGLPRLRTEDRDPSGASTYGTGQLVRAALERGAREIILGLGGSATVDAGAGALEALGVRLLDAAGRPIAPGNQGLASLDRIDPAALDPRLAGIRLRLATDVTNPLCGPLGAAAVFGPQKGARPEDIAVLDANLARFAAVVRKDLHTEVATTAGAGAAGGLAAGLLAIGARCESGIDLILDAVGFSGQLVGADLVLAGEGRIDGQSAQGKVLSGVLARAQAAGVPVVALAGAVLDQELEPLYAAGLVAAFPIVRGPLSLEQAVAQAPGLLEDATAAVVRLWQAVPMEQGAQRVTASTKNRP